MAAADEAKTVAAIKAAFLAVTDPNDWTGDGSPEGWKVMDRAYTRAEARSIRAAGPALMLAGGDTSGLVAELLTARGRRNQVIGTQSKNILPDPTRLRSRRLGNMVADAMREKYPDRIDIDGPLIPL